MEEPYCFWRKSVFQNGRWRPFWKKFQKKLCIDLKYTARNAIESDFRSSKMAQIGLPKCPPAAILKKKLPKKKRVAYWSETARNTFEIDFRSSKMAAGSHFVKKIKVVYWSEMVRNVIESDFLTKLLPAAILDDRKSLSITFLTICCVLIWNGEKCDQKWFFGHPKWPLAAINLWRKKVAYWSEMVRNAIKSDFRSSKMAAGSHFVKQNCVLIWNGEKCDRKWFSVIQNGRRQPFCEKNKSCVFLWNGKKCDRNSFSVIQNGGGGGHHNGQAVNHSGIYTVFALGQIHQF